MRAKRTDIRDISFPIHRVVIRHHGTLQVSVGTSGQCACGGLAPGLLVGAAIGAILAVLVGAFLAQDSTPEAHLNVT
eukprot:6159277-Amphidinium_carterae.1